MIYYFYKRKRHPHVTINLHLEWRGKSLKSIIFPMTYDKLFSSKAILTGTYIFSDIERLTTEDTEKAARIWQA
ncbi:MAG: hypothetical protein HY356_01560, partial [Gammaproteobacteria bacterium]|nr:hypothetical protein [Gammaproteobacteria bacterium]